MRRNVASWSFVAALAFVVSASTAAAKSYRAETYQSAIQILPDGDLRVTETVAFRFSGGPYTYVYRSIPLRGVDDITIESSADSFALRRLRRVVEVKWRFPAVRDTTRTFALTYRVRGALAVDAGTTRLDWRAFPDERNYVIEHATADLEWPQAWGEPVALAATPRATRIERRNTAAHFDVGRLAAETTLRVRAGFPLSAAAVRPPEWQARRMMQARNASTVALIAAGLLVLGIGFVVALYRESAPNRVNFLPLRTTQPPAPLPAALAGSLRRGDPALLDAVACFLDLAARGYVQFDTLREKRWWSSGSYTVRRLQPSRDLAEWERIVLDAAFRERESNVVPVRKAWSGIHKSLGAFRDAVRAELRRRGELDPNAAHGRWRLQVCALAFGLASLVSLVIVPLAWSVAGPWLLLPAGALFLVSMVALATASAVPRLTTVGQERAAAWKGFGAHLKTLSKQQGLLDAQHFQSWFPYAVALGLAPAWLNAGKRSKLPVPSWFSTAPGADGMNGFIAVFGGSGAGNGGAFAGGAGAGGGAGGGGSGAG